MTYTFTFKYSTLVIRISDTSYNSGFSGGSSIPRGELVTYKMSDIPGKEAATLVNEQLQPGTYEVTFDGSSLASGIYFYQLKTEKILQTKKLILLK